jgi:hypothetical protein
VGAVGLDCFTTARGARRVDRRCALHLPDRRAAPSRSRFHQDMGAAAAARRLRVALAPDARVVLSERDDRAEDPATRSRRR